MGKPSQASSVRHASEYDHALPAHSGMHWRTGAKGSGAPPESAGEGRVTDNVTFHLSRFQVTDLVNPCLPDQLIAHEM